MTIYWFLDSPANPQDNLHHVSVWNVIEWIFGVLKWWFKILTIAPEYSMKTQAHIPPALAAIHNFIWSHDNNEIDDLISQVYNPQPGALGELAVGPPLVVEYIHAQEKWDEIAAVMWE